MLTQKGKDSLRTIVRETLTAAVRGENYSVADPGLEDLHVEGGCFVTYKTDGRLRGCLGCFESEDPLYLTVSHYAMFSATQDYRFVGNQIREEELPQVHFDISVLSPLTPCDNPEAIELGKHGIYVRKGGRSGVFLPQVAPEQGWDLEQFWGYCCSHKAGLDYNAWRQPDVETLTFTAEVIEGTMAAD